ncbi:hypothetical protein ACZ90_58625 [Streptomyces albus subsp. albus]|nr:hypothetical protein ACZ90_58625 [Streptomyces albus subsp. albus]
MFNLIEELFAPGRKHTEEERNRLDVTRDDQGDGDPGRGPIDLDSGRVVIRPRKGHGAPLDVGSADRGPAAADRAAPRVPSGLRSA